MLPPWPFPENSEAWTSSANGPNPPDATTLYNKIVETEKMCNELGKMLHTVYLGLEKVSAQLDHLENPAAMIPFGFRPAPKS